MKDEVLPKNILMMGPTGVGKTEISRRLSKLAQAPFIKVEATRFTEVGYVGRDVEQIVRDLIEIATKKGRKNNKKIKLGICGEHGGDPKSIDFCASAGLDYVSCSPYRVPIARLAAAQAQLKK